jgi:protease I
MIMKFRSSIPARLRFPAVAFLVLAIMPGLSAAQRDPDTGPPRLLFLLAHGFNRGEHYEPYFSFVAMGYAVDVASFEAGPVLLDKDNATPDARGRDFTANLAMRDVRDIGRYAALIVPGGYSPGNLEDDPDALRIVRAFFEAGKPVGAVCHGPRLLARAGVLEGRVVAAWNEVASEIPDAWARGEMGTYMDQQVVVDGDLITCRYPEDVGAWVARIAAHLERRGGVELPDKLADAIYLAPHLTEGHDRWTMTVGSRNNHVQARVIHNEDGLARLAAEGGHADVVLVFPNAASHAMLASADGEALLAALGDPPVHPLAGDEPALQLREAVAVAQQLSMRQRPQPEETVYDAVIALTPGFDDRVAVVMEAFLQRHGLATVRVSHETGWVRGLAGLPLHADASYTAPPRLAERVVVVAPGGLWPREDPDARQAEQPDWLAGQAKRDQLRADWITGLYKDGHVLVTFGFDSMWLTADAAFAGLPFAASDQTVWSFGRYSAGKYIKGARALRSAERLFSARGADSLPQLLQLLEQPALDAVRGR